MRRSLLLTLTLAAACQPHDGPPAGGVPANPADVVVRSGEIVAYSRGAPPAQRYSGVAIDFRASSGAIAANTRSVGGCLLTSLAGDPRAYTSVSAGTVSITGGVRDLALAALADGTYPLSIDWSDGLFLGGEPLRIAAAGGVVPPFAVTLVAPTPVVVTEPAYAGDSDWPAIDRSRDLLLSWTPGAADDRVVVEITATYEVSLRLDCESSAATGALTIPAIALSSLWLPAADGTIGVSGSIEVSVTRATTLVAGSYAIALSTETSAVATAGGDVIADFLLR